MIKQALLASVAVAALFEPPPRVVVGVDFSDGDDVSVAWSRPYFDSDDLVLIAEGRPPLFIFGEPSTEVRMGLPT